MKATLLLLGILLLPAAALALDVDDIVKLSKSGVSADVIIHRIDASDDVFHLSNDDIIALKDAGVSDRIIMRMIDTERDGDRDRDRYRDDEGDRNDRDSDREDNDDNRYHGDSDVDWNLHLGLGYSNGYYPGFHDYSWYPYSSFLYDYFPSYPYYTTYCPPSYYGGYSYGHYRPFRNTYPKHFRSPGRSSWNRGSTHVRGGYGGGYSRGAGSGYSAPAPQRGVYRDVQRKSPAPGYSQPRSPSPPPPAPAREPRPDSGGRTRTVVRK